MAEPKAAGAKAAESAEQQDPSMEEILQSIRRIIAEEEKRPEDGSINSDVLELTELVQEEGDGFGEESGETSSGEPVDVLASIDNALGAEAAKVLDQEIPTPPPAPAEEPPIEVVDVAPLPEPELEPEPVAEAPPPVEEPSLDDSLLSQAAAAEATASLKKLNVPRPAPAAPSSAPMAFRGGYTVEDLALEALRPMLKDWLDTNLPHIVERIVEREVKKLANSD